MSQYSRHSIQPLSSSQHAGDSVENVVQALAYIFGQKAQNEVTGFLQNKIFAPITPIGLNISQVLRPIQLDSEETADLPG